MEESYRNYIQNYKDTKYWNHCDLILKKSHIYNFQSCINTFLVMKKHGPWSISSKAQICFKFVSSNYIRFHCRCHMYKNPPSCRPEVQSIPKLLDVTTAAAAVNLSDDTHNVFMSIVHWLKRLSTDYGHEVCTITEDNYRSCSQNVWQFWNWLWTMGQQPGRFLNISNSYVFSIKPLYCGNIWGLYENVHYSLSILAASLLVYWSTYNCACSRLWKLQTSNSQQK